MVGASPRLTWPCFHQITISPLSTPYTISACSASDLEADFTCINSAFGHCAPFINIFFPAHSTPASFAQGVHRLTTWQKSDPHAHFLRAVATPSYQSSTSRDPPNDGVLGHAIWKFMNEKPPAELEKVEDVEEVWAKLGGEEEARRAEEVLFARQIWAEYVIPRSGAVKEAGGKGCQILEMLAVHPDAQKMGIGEALTRWGTKKADEQGIEAVVEATPNAVKTYHKCGFRTTIDKMRFDVDDKFKDRDLPTLVFLRRQVGVNGPPQG